jgi:hypothetical protein
MERIRVIDVFQIVIIGGAIVSVLMAIPGVILLTKPIKIRKGQTEVGGNNDWLIKQLKKAKHSIQILSGELHPRIFDDEMVLKEINNAINRGVKIEIIAGPDILIPSGKKEVIDSKPILKLVDEDKISLWIPTKRNHLKHFTILDSNFYLEKPHPSAAPVRDYEIRENSISGTAELRQYFMETRENAKKFTPELKSLLNFSRLNPA